MSWGEVIKFLNKRKDKALNEIIEEFGNKFTPFVEAVETKVAGGTLTTSVATVLSVTGKGRLMTFDHYHSNGTSTVQIIIDDVVVLNGKLTGNNNSYPVILHVGNPSEVYPIADGSTTRTTLATMTGLSGGAYSQRPIGVQPLSPTQWTVSAAGGVVFVPIYTPICFEKSLQIKCKGATATDKWACVYELR